MINKKRWAIGGSVVAIIVIILAAVLGSVLPGKPHQDGTVITDSVAPDLFGDGVSTMSFVGDAATISASSWNPTSVVDAQSSLVSLTSASTTSETSILSTPSSVNAQSSLIGLSSATSIIETPVLSTPYGVNTQSSLVGFSSEPATSETRVRSTPYSVPSNINMPVTSLSHSNPSSLAESVAIDPGSAFAVSSKIALTTPHGPSGIASTPTAWPTGLQSLSGSTAAEPLASTRSQTSATLLSVIAKPPSLKSSQSQRQSTSASRIQSSTGASQVSSSHLSRTTESIFSDLSPQSVVKTVVPALITSDAHSSQATSTQIEDAQPALDSDAKVPISLGASYVFSKSSKTTSSPSMQAPLPVGAPSVPISPDQTTSSTLVKISHSVGAPHQASATMPTQSSNHIQASYSSIASHESSTRTQEPLSSSATASSVPSASDWPLPLTYASYSSSKLPESSLSMPASTSSQLQSAGTLDGPLESNSVVQALLSSPVHVTTSQSAFSGMLQGPSSSWIQVTRSESQNTSAPAQTATSVINTRTDTATQPVTRSSPYAATYTATDASTDMAPDVMTSTTTDIATYAVTEAATSITSDASTYPTTGTTAKAITSIATDAAIFDASISVISKVASSATTELSTLPATNASTSPATEASTYTTARASTFASTVPRTFTTTMASTHTTTEASILPATEATTVSSISTTRQASTYTTTRASTSSMNVASVYSTAETSIYTSTEAATSTTTGMSVYSTTEASTFTSTGASNFAMTESSTTPATETTNSTTTESSAYVPTSRSSNSTQMTSTLSPEGLSSTQTLVMTASSGIATSSTSFQVTTSLAGLPATVTTTQPPAPTSTSDDPSYQTRPKWPACKPYHSDVVDLVQAGPDCPYHECMPYALISHISDETGKEATHRVWQRPDSIHMYWDFVDPQQMSSEGCPFYSLSTSGANALNKVLELAQLPEQSETNCMAYIRIQPKNAKGVGNEVGPSDSPEDSIEFGTELGGTAPLGTWIRGYSMRAMQHVDRSNFTEHCKRFEPQAAHAPPGNSPPPGSNPVKQVDHKLGLKIGIPIALTVVLLGAAQVWQEIGPTTWTWHPWGPPVPHKHSPLPKPETSLPEGEIPWPAELGPVAPLPPDPPGTGVPEAPLPPEPPGTGIPEGGFSWPEGMGPGIPLEGASPIPEEASPTPEESFHTPEEGFHTPEETGPGNPIPPEPAGNPVPGNEPRIGEWNLAEDRVEPEWPYISTQDLRELEDVAQDIVDNAWSENLKANLETKLDPTQLRNFGDQAWEEEITRFLNDNLRVRPPSHPDVAEFVDFMKEHFDKLWEQRFYTPPEEPFQPARIPQIGDDNAFDNDFGRALRSYDVKQSVADQVRQAEVPGRPNPPSNDPFQAMQNVASLDGASDYVQQVGNSFEVVQTTPSQSWSPGSAAQPAFNPFTGALEFVGRLGDLALHVGEDAIGTLVPVGATVAGEAAAVGGMGLSWASAATGLAIASPIPALDTALTGLLAGGSIAGKTIPNWGDFVQTFLQGSQVPRSEGSYSGTPHELEWRKPKFAEGSSAKNPDTITMVHKIDPDTFTEADAIALAPFLKGLIDTKPTEYGDPAKEQSNLVNYAIPNTDVDFLGPRGYGYLPEGSISPHEEECSLKRDGTCRPAWQQIYFGTIGSTYVVADIEAEIEADRKQQKAEAECYRALKAGEYQTCWPNENMNATSTVTTASTTTMWSNATVTLGATNTNTRTGNASTTWYQPAHTQSSGFQNGSSGFTMSANGTITLPPRPSATRFPLSTGTGGTGYRLSAIATAAVSLSAIWSNSSTQTATSSLALPTGSASLYPFANASSYSWLTSWTSTFRTSTTGRPDSTAMNVTSTVLGWLNLTSTSPSPSLTSMFPKPTGTGVYTMALNATSTRLVWLNSTSTIMSSTLTSMFPSSTSTAFNTTIMNATSTMFNSTSIFSVPTSTPTAVIISPDSDAVYEKCELNTDHMCACGTDKKIFPAYQVFGETDMFACPEYLRAGMMNGVWQENLFLGQWVYRFDVNGLISNEVLGDEIVCPNEGPQLLCKPSRHPIAVMTGDYAPARVIDVDKLEQERSLDRRLEAVTVAPSANSISSISRRDADEGDVCSFEAIKNDGYCHCGEHYFLAIPMLPPTSSNSSIASDTFFFACPSSLLANRYHGTWQQFAAQIPTNSDRVQDPLLTSSGPEASCPEPLSSTALCVAKFVTPPLEVFADQGDSDQEDTALPHSESCRLEPHQDMTGSCRCGDYYFDAISPVPWEYARPEFTHACPEQIRDGHFFGTWSDFSLSTDETKRVQVTAMATGPKIDCSSGLCVMRHNNEGKKTEPALEKPGMVIYNGEPAIECGGYDFYLRFCICGDRRFRSLNVATWDTEHHQDRKVRACPEYIRESDSMFEGRWQMLEFVEDEPMRPSWGSPLTCSMDGPSPCFPKVYH